MSRNVTSTLSGRSSFTALDLARSDNSSGLRQPRILANQPKAPEQKTVISRFFLDTTESEILITVLLLKIFSSPNGKIVQRL